MINLKIYNDIGAKNPRTSRDLLPPLITKGWREYWDDSYGIDLIDFIRSKLNKKNMYKIADVLWYSKDDIKYRVDKYYYYACYSVIEDIITELEHIDDIEKVLDILKVKNYKRTSRWYCQWDVVDCILVATDEWIRGVGIKNKDIKDSLKNSAKLYDARAWWDVYRYKVVKYNELYNKDWVLSTIQEEEEIDSCRGFYWDDWLKKIFEEIKHYWITEEMFDYAKENIIC